MKNKGRFKKAYNKSAVRRWAAFLLCAALMGSMVSSALPALAVGDDEKETYVEETGGEESYEGEGGEEETYCEHHSVHTEECGYVEAVEGQRCNHEHDEDCGYAKATECNHEHDEDCGYVKAVEAVEGQDCAHEHDEECGPNGQNCTHVHDEDCGYVKAVEAVEGQPCTHKHDEQCGYAEAAECAHEHDEKCGYVEAVEGQPCQFVCEICVGNEEETGQAVTLSEDQTIAPRNVQEEGLIAYFTFDDSNNRLYDSTGKGVPARLREVKVGDRDVGNEIADVSEYFDNVEPGALHLSDNACLELDETADFDNMTEMTVEMKIKIIERGEDENENKGGVKGYDSHWLFYAAQPGNPDPEKDKCLGVVLRGDKNLRIHRQKNGNTGELGEAGFPAGYNINNWNTIRIIYKPSNMALYVNNIRIVDKGLGNKTSDYFKAGQKLWFGHSAWPGDPNFKGYIDEIKIYNYANYNKPGGGYLDGYIDEQKYIVESVDPPNTTVHMFDYWIKDDQLANDYGPELQLNDILDNGINEGHLLLFAGSDGSGLSSVELDSTENVGSWNNYLYDQGADNKRPVGQNVRRAIFEPYSGIVDNTLGDDGYPRLALDKLKATGLFKAPTNTANWYESGNKTESLAYLFNPYQENNGKASYNDVTGLFRLDEKGYYYFNCNKTFAELNREQSRRPKVSTDNNRITLYERSSDYKDFFPFNDATDLFYIDMNNKLTKANGTNMGVQATTDEPFNHYFGMTVETTFEQAKDGQIDLPGGKREDVNFYFSGDDDVWIFIDGVLVADLGGLHNEVSVTINFATGEIAYEGRADNFGETAIKNLDGKDDGGGRKCYDTTLRKMFEDAHQDGAIEWNPKNKEVFADGSKHTLKFYYLERGNNLSRCTIGFNMQYVERNSSDDDDHTEPLEDILYTEQLSEETVTLNVSTKLPKKNDEAVPAGVLASPDTGDSKMVGLWLTLLVLSTVGIVAVNRTRRRRDKYHS